LRFETLEKSVLSNITLMGTQLIVGALALLIERVDGVG
jgi:hypothetical protein